MCRGWQLGGVLRWDEMRWDCSCFGAAMCSAIAWGSGPSINPWVVGGSETLGLISRGCRHWVKKHVPGRMTAWRGAGWCRRDEMRWDEMRWDRSCFGAAMCSAMAWGSGPSINPWVVETLGLISTGCRHWVKKHVPGMTAWRGAAWCRRDEMRWDEMRWDCSCFGAAMCSAMACGSGPSINPWVVGGSETLGLISTGCIHWVKKHVQRMAAWRGAEWCRRDEMRWDETVLPLVQRCAVPSHGEVGPQLIHGWSGGQRHLD